MTRASEPSRWRDAIALLTELGPESRVIAGGHSLLPMMKLRLANFEYLVDINDLPEPPYLPRPSAEAVSQRHRMFGYTDEDLRLLLEFQRKLEQIVRDQLVRLRGELSSGG